MSARKRKLDPAASSPSPDDDPRTRPRTDDPQQTPPDDEPRTTPATDDPPPPPLPASSGDVAVPEASAAHLFSVYVFLRSFSRRLFLSPFTLDDFVRSLNRTARDPLCDAVHLALLRSLRRHLEARVADGSAPATKCLRLHDWALLDSLTWPVFLIEYLYTMGYFKEKAGDVFISAMAFKGEYYALPVGTKLKVLQMLCDDLIDSAELRAEIESREDTDEEDDCGVNAGLLLENGPRRVHPRNAKTKACKNVEALKISIEPDPKSKVREVPPEDAADDGNSDECWLCGMDGTLICCDGCPSAYHSRCIGLSKMSLPEGLWFCPECTVSKSGPTCSRIAKGVRGAEVFGIDPYERIFLGTCNYLLVIGTSLNAEPFIRYYNQDDVPRVLNTLCLEREHASIYSDICKGISEYWDVQPVSTVTRTAESVVDPLPEKQPSVTSINKSSDAYCIAEENPAKDVTMKSIDNEAISCQEDYCIKSGFNDLVPNPVHRIDFPDRQEDDSSNQVMSHKKMFEGADENFSTVKDDQVTPGNIKPIVQNVQTPPLCVSVVSDISYSSQICAQRLTLAGNMSPALEENGVHREYADSSISLVKSGSVFVSRDSTHGSHISDEKSKVQSERSANNAASSKPQTYSNQYVHGDVAASAAANLAVLMPEDSEDSRVQQTRTSSNSRKTLAASIATQMKAFVGAAMQFMWPSPDRKLMEVPRERCGWCIACKGAATNKKGCLLNLAAANAIKGSARCMSSLRPLKHDESHLPVIAAHIWNMEENLHGLLVGHFLDAEFKKQWQSQLREASSCRVLKILLLELEKNIRGIAFSESWNKRVDDWTVEFSSAITSVPVAVPNQKRGPVGRRNKRQSVASDSGDLSLDKSWEWWRGGKLSKIVIQKAVLPSSLVKRTARQGGYRRIPGFCYLEDSGLPRRSRRFAWIASVEMCKNASQLALQVRYLDAHIRWRDLFRPEQVSLDGKGSDVDASIFRNAVICDKKIVENKHLYALTFLNQKHLPLRVTKNILGAEKTQEENDKLWFSEVHIPLYLIKEYEEKFIIKSLHPTNINCRSLHKLTKSHVTAYRRDVFLYLFHKGDKPSKFSCASCKKDVSLRDALRCKTCQGYCHKDCATSSSVKTEDDLEFSFTCNMCFQAQFAAVNGKDKKIFSCQIPVQGLNRQLTTTKGMPQASHAAKVAGVAGCRNTSSPVGMFGHHSASRPVTKFEYHPPAQAVVKTLFRSTAQPVHMIGNHTAEQPITKFGYHSTTQVVVKSEVLSDKKSSVSRSNSERKARNGGLCVNFGLIWKKKKGEDSGKDFRLQNIVLKSKEGMGSLRKPTCFLCKTPYHSDLMYICCEKCLNWYHADALQLEEAQIFDLVGFKCCKCRRIRSPKCPYAGPFYKKPDVFDPLKQENAEGSKEAACGLPRPELSPSLMSGLETEDLITLDVDDPLLHSSASVESIALQTTEAELQLNKTFSVSQNHHKLSVRRPMPGHGMDVNGAETIEDADPFYAANSESPGKLPVKRNDSLNFGLEVESDSVTKETNTMCYSEKASSAQIELDFPDIDGFSFGEDNVAGFDQEVGVAEDMEYEPQTYFSFTELLNLKDGMDNSYDDTVDVPDDWCPTIGSDDIGTILQDGSSNDPYGAPCEMRIEEAHDSNENQFNGAACEICKYNNPVPNLMCEICSLLIHSHCSPWVETKEHLGDGLWRCGRCREWR